MDISKNNNHFVPELSRSLLLQQQQQQQQRFLNLSMTPLQTPPIITSSYNNGVNAVTPPPDSNKPVQQQLRIPNPTTYSNTFVNMSANLAGMTPFTMNFATGTQQQPQTQPQQFLVNNDNNNNNCNNVNKSNTSRDVNHPPTNNHRLPSDRPESIVFLYQIPNDAKIYLIKCVEVSQLLDIDPHNLEDNMSNKPPFIQRNHQNLKQNLTQHLAVRLQNPPQHPQSHAPHSSHSSQNPTSYQIQQQQQQQLALQQHQQQQQQQQNLRHHPYQQQQRNVSKTSPNNNPAGKNIKTQALEVNNNNNISNNNNNTNVVSQAPDELHQQQQQQQQQQLGMNNNIELMLPMTTPSQNFGGATAYMMTPSATPHMRHDQLVTPDFANVSNFLASQQQQVAMLTTQQNLFEPTFKNEAAN